MNIELVEWRLNDVIPSVAIAKTARAITKINRYGVALTIDWDSS